MIGVNDAMNQVLWTKYFLDAQGYFYTHVTVYQDNQASILMEKNGKFSSTKNTRHISVRYFFVTDCLKRHDNLNIEYCPTEDMWADQFTKPLTGALFQKMRNMSLGIEQALIPSYNEEYDKFEKEHRARAAANMLELGRHRFEEEQARARIARRSV